MENKQLGNLGESVAGLYLEAEGYTVLERNFTCRLGEIDIVCKKGNIIAFVEVKTRSSESFGMPREAVDKNKVNHIKKAAAVYLLSNNVSDYDVRYDVFEVFCNQIENAF